MFHCSDMCCISLILSRLERLQRIFNKVQMESGLCDDHLSHLDSLLQKVCMFSNFTWRSGHALVILPFAKHFKYLIHCLETIKYRKTGYWFCLRYCSGSRTVDMWKPKTKTYDATLPFRILPCWMQGNLLSTQQRWTGSWTRQKTPSVCSLMMFRSSRMGATLRQNRCIAGTLYHFSHMIRFTVVKWVLGCWYLV